MKRPLQLLVVVAIVVAAGLGPGGCSCSVTGGEGDKAVDVTMGGKIVKSDYLSFQTPSYNGQDLQIRNTASEHTLEIGIGTPITTGDGAVVATAVNGVSIAPGATASVRLSAPLAVGQTYYLGAAPNGGKPTIRQLFICPGGTGGGLPGGGVPEIPDVEEPSIAP
jgi:hypothetical protein